MCSIAGAEAKEDDGKVIPLVHAGGANCVFRLTGAGSGRSAPKKLEPPHCHDGEDAMFVTRRAAGVLDGIGAWTTEQVDCGVYTRQFCEIAAYASSLPGENPIVFPSQIAPFQIRQPKMRQSWPDMEKERPDADDDAGADSSKEIVKGKPFTDDDLNELFMRGVTMSSLPDSDVPKLRHAPVCIDNLLTIAHRHTCSYGSSTVAAVAPGKGCLRVYTIGDAGTVVLRRQSKKKSWKVIKATDLVMEKSDERIPL